MPTLYADVHISTTAMELLRRDGAGIGLRVEAFRDHDPTAPDPVHLALAAQQQWTILTRDEDFRILHDLWQVVQAWRPLEPVQRHAGIMWVASGPARLADDAMVPPVVEFLRHAPVLTDRCVVLSLRLSGIVWEDYFPFRRQQRATAR